MRTVWLVIAVVAVGALAFGGFIVGNEGSPVEGLQQLSDPEASAIAATDTQLGQFTLAVLFIVGNVIGLGVTLRILIPLLSHGVERAETREDAPVDFSLAPSTEGNSIGAFATRNAPLVLASMSVGLVLVFVLVAVLFV